MWQHHLFPMCSGAGKLLDLPTQPESFRRRGGRLRVGALQLLLVLGLPLIRSQLICWSSAVINFIDFHRLIIL